MALIQTIKSALGFKVYPITKTNAVYDKRFGRLDKRLPDMVIVDDSMIDPEEEPDITDADTLGGRYTADDIESMFVASGSGRALDGKEVGESVVTFETAKSVTEITSGNKLSSIFGTVAKLISDYITHIKKTGNSSAYGHVYLSDMINEGLGSDNNYAATPKAVAKVSSNVAAVSRELSTLSDTVSTQGQSVSTLTQSVDTVTTNLNSGNLGFEYVDGEGLYYSVKVGADTVRKKCESGAECTRLYGSVDQCTSDSYTFEEDCKAIVSCSVASEYNHGWEIRTSCEDYKELDWGEKYEAGVRIVHCVYVGNFKTGDYAGFSRISEDEGGVHYLALSVIKIG